MAGRWREPVCAEWCWNIDKNTFDHELKCCFLWYSCIPYIQNTRDLLLLSIRPFPYFALFHSPSTSLWQAQTHRTNERKPTHKTQHKHQANMEVNIQTSHGSYGLSRFVSFLQDFCLWNLRLRTALELLRAVDCFRWQLTIQFPAGQN